MWFLAEAEEFKTNVQCSEEANNRSLVNFAQVSREAYLLFFCFTSNGLLKYRAVERLIF